MSNFEIAKMEKLVGEYNIWELKKIPYGKFKIKIFVDLNGSYTGFTNLQVVDETGSYYCAVGHGKTEKEALDDTIQQFFKKLEVKENWDEQDFECSDPYDF